MSRIDPPLHTKLEDGGRNHGLAAPHQPNRPCSLRLFTLPCRDDECLRLRSAAGQPSLPAAWNLPSTAPSSETGAERILKIRCLFVQVRDAGTDYNSAPRQHRRSPAVTPCQRTGLRRERVARLLPVVRGTRSTRADRG